MLRNRRCCRLVAHGRRAATGDAGRARGGRRDELNASPQWLKEAAALD